MKVQLKYYLDGQTIIKTTDELKTKTVAPRFVQIINEVVDKHRMFDKGGNELHRYKLNSDDFDFMSAILFGEFHMLEDDLSDAEYEDMETIRRITYSEMANTRCSITNAAIIGHISTLSQHQNMISEKFPYECFEISSDRTFIPTMIDYQNQMVWRQNGQASDNGEWLNFDEVTFKKNPNFVELSEIFS